MQWELLYLNYHFDNLKANGYLFIYFCVHLPKKPKKKKKTQKTLFNAIIESSCNYV